MLVNHPLKLHNRTNVFLINLNSILYRVFYEIFMNIGNITNINTIIINRKIVHLSAYSCYFSLTVKSFQFFALSGYIFAELTNKNLLLPL